MTQLAVRGGTVDVLVDGRHIGAVGADASSGDTPAVLDATGCTVLPGFVDLQVNGAVGVDLTSAPERVDEVSAFLPQTGVTSFMPTVISSAHEVTTHALRTLEQARQRGVPGARSLGVHLEGPFLNPARGGAHPRRQLRTATDAERDTSSPADSRPGPHTESGRHPGSSPRPGSNAATIPGTGSRPNASSYAGTDSGSASLASTRAGSSTGSCPTATTCGSATRSHRAANKPGPRTEGRTGSRAAFRAKTTTKGA